MRIGIFTDTYLPYINGVTTSVLMLKKGLERMGHIVYVITVNDENMQYKIEENGRILRIPGIPTGIYDYRLTGIYPLKAIKIIKKWNLDIIHSQTEFGIGTFARILSKQFNIPLVHTYHTMYEDYVHYITKGYFNKSSKKIVEYLTLFYCDKTITELVVPTKKTYELFKDKYQVNRNVYIVPTGIDVERFYPENNRKLDRNGKRKNLGLTSDDFVILFVGRIASEKNILLLINSMPSIINKCPQCKLLIVGDGPDIDKYKKLIIKRGIEKNVVFAGKVPWKEITEYYLISDVFATASKTETQGLTVIEAMAASLPVVCIEDESFINTVIDKLNGRIFNRKSEYKNIIVELYNNRNELEKLSNQAKISAEMHSTKYFASKIFDVYRIAISNKPKSSVRIPLVEKITNIIKKK